MLIRVSCLAYSGRFGELTCIFINYMHIHQMTTGLGYLFGQAFGDDHALAFWLAFGVALSITAMVEIIRWARDRGRSDLGEPTDAVIAHADDADRTLGE